MILNSAVDNSCYRKHLALTKREVHLEEVSLITEIMNETGQMSCHEVKFPYSGNAQPLIRYVFQFGKSFY